MLAPGCLESASSAEGARNPFIHLCDNDRVVELKVLRNRGRKSPMITSCVSCLRRWGQIHPRRLYFGREYIYEARPWSRMFQLMQRGTNHICLISRKTGGIWGHQHCWLCAGQFTPIITFSSHNVPVTEHLLFHILPNSWDYNTFSAWQAGKYKMEAIFAISLITNEVAFFLVWFCFILFLNLSFSAIMPCFYY